MSLSQKGAQYESRDAIANIPSSLRELAKHALRAFDDIASQVQAVRTQGNFGQKGPPTAPHPVTAISVTPQNGFATVALTHNDAPAGTQYVIEYSSTPNFTPSSTVRVDNGISRSMQQFLKGQTLYWRAAPMFPTSGLASWTYLGSPSSPTAVQF